MGLISVSLDLISGTIGLKPDHVDLKSDLGGLKSGRTEIPILKIYFGLLKLKNILSELNTKGNQRAINKNKNGNLWSQARIEI